MKIFLAGFPGDVGGANTEVWHTLKLWRRMGLDVTVLALGGAAGQPDYAGWAYRLQEIDVPIRSCQHADALPCIEGLAGAVVVSFCDTRFVRQAERFWSLGCKLVYAPCMCFPWPAEEDLGKPFDRYVFQSRFQRDQLAPALTALGYTPEQGVLIRGAFDPADFPFRPEENFPNRFQAAHVGRISRPHSLKFPPDLWDPVTRLWELHAPMFRFHALGWGADAEAKCGGPPAFARVYPPGSESARSFYPGLHVLLQMTDPAGPPENWPRVGLEAMAAGVPLVVDRRGGWCEMIEDQRTGLLVDGPSEAIHACHRLLCDSALRLQIARCAREAVIAWTDPETIGPAWLDLFSSLQAGG